VKLSHGVKRGEIVLSEGVHHVQSCTAMDGCNLGDRICSTLSPAIKVLNNDYRSLITCRE
jgi:hypothetical protein